MESRVKEILSWYSSDSPGTRTNISRLLNHGRLAGTGKLVILPVDQGFEHGPVIFGLRRRRQAHQHDLDVGVA